MNRADILGSEICSWHRFETDGLTVVAELIGAFHRFDFEGRGILVSLPLQREADRESGAARVTVRRTSDNAPLVYEIDEIELRGAQPDSPAIAQIRAHRESGVRPEDVQDLTRRVIEAAGPVALLAFDHWLRVVRWQARDGRIGRRVLQATGSAWGTHLRETDSNRQIAPGHTIVRTWGAVPLTLPTWEAIGQELRAGREAPLFFDLLFDGEGHLAIGDARRATVDFANACEVLLKTLLDLHLPSGLLDVAREQLLRAPARVLLRKFGESLLGPIRWSQLGKKGVRDLEALFDARNNAVHSHNRTSCTIEACLVFRVAAGRLVDLGCEVYESLRQPTTTLT